MSNAALDYSLVAPGRSFGRAEVVGLDPTGRKLRVRPAEGRGDQPVWAESALPAECGFALGQQVLVAEAEAGEFYVCGVLGGVPRTTTRFTSKSGASVEVGDDQETLRVRSPEGELVFEYDPAAGRTRVCVPAGDLEIAAPDGSIRLVSGRDVHLHGARALELNGGDRIGLGVGAGAVESAVELGRSLLRLRAPVLRLQAQRGEATVGEMAVRGETLSARWGAARLVADRLETWAVDVITRARDVRQVVEHLWQLKVERIRAVARGACQLQARKMVLRADEDVKVQGDRIELG